MGGADEEEVVMLESQNEYRNTIMISNRLLYGLWIIILLFNDMSCKRRSFNLP